MKNIDILLEGLYDALQAYATQNDEQAEALERLKELAAEHQYACEHDD